MTVYRTCSLVSHSLKVGLVGELACSNAASNPTWFPIARLIRMFSILSSGADPRCMKPLGAESRFSWTTKVDAQTVEESRDTARVKLWMKDWGTIIISLRCQRIDSRTSNISSRVFIALYLSRRSASEKSHYDRLVRGIVHRKVCVVFLRLRPLGANCLVKFCCHLDCAS